MDPFLDLMNSIITKTELFNSSSAWLQVATKRTMAARF